MTYSVDSKLLEKALELQSNGIMIYEPNGGPVYHNPTAHFLLGNEVQTPITVLLAGHIDLDLFMNSPISSPSSLNLELNNRKLNLTLSLDDTQHFHLTLRDIQEEERLRLLLDEAQATIKQLDNAINGANIGCWDYFPQEGKIVANKTWLTQKHYQDKDFRKDDALFSEVINGLDKWSEIVHPDDLEPTLAIIQAHLDGKTPTYDAEFRIICGDGKWRWIHDRGQVFERDELGNAIRMNGVHIDITEAKELQEQIERLLRIDSLTKVMNRRYFESHTDETIKECRRNNSFIAFLLLDIDNFKEFNDTYGHQEGDRSLRTLGKLINESLQREGDACFRLGGEEFAIIFQVNTKETAEKFAFSLKDSIENQKIPHRHNTASPYLTISIGLWCDNASEQVNVSEMYRLADSLLYKAKSNGRNRIEVSWNTE